ncbi:MAG: hypothetical protein NTV01_15060 [Bacteroidia bacterium]|nr:hypothetical protein [Bacteroidia bacterium]
MTLGIFGSVAQWERELISSRTKRGLDDLKKRNVKLGSPQNLTNAARQKGVQALIRNHLFIEHFQMKNGYLNYPEISKQLNQNIYTTRYGCRFSPGIVRRLVENVND